MLKNRKQILKGKFKYSGKVVYCGSEVKAHPVRISSKELVMEYKDLKSGQKDCLTMYPFRKGELLKRIREAGFSKAQAFYDFQARKTANPDFITYVAHK
jgi:hypothetical protein